MNPLIVNVVTADPSQLTCCVCDNGLYLPLAQKLAPSFKRMLYWSEWQESFPTVNKRVIGDGFEGIDRIDDIWEHKNEINLFIFPDIYRSALQIELQTQGHLVWGSRRGDRLETNRGAFMRVLQEVGLPVPTFQEFVGLTELRAHLKNREDVYLKISKYRGSFETCHWRSWREDEGMLDNLAVKFGPLQNLMTFYVFDALETDLELGVDTFCIDGNFPALMLNGLEAKDKGYLGAVTKREDLPEQLRAVLDAFGPVLSKYNYRNAFSAEVRVVEGAGYFIDPCCRFPVPGSGAEMELIGNLAEVITAGATGELVEPEMTAQFAVECVLTSKCEKHAWRVVDFCDEVKPFVKCGDSCEVDGRICWPPNQQHGEEIGWIFATGDTIKEAVETMKEHVKLLPDGVHACTESIFDLLKEAVEAESEGIEIADQIPEPVTALETTT
jgi:hypothetical protein